MMISNVNNQSLRTHQNLNQDESIHYRGHGKLESSSQNLSALHVISHELDHVAEYKADAYRKGAEIRNIDVDIHYEIRNGKMVAVGGETKVTSSVKKFDQPEKPSYENLYVDSLFPTIDEINARKAEQKNKEVQKVPSEEEILKERLQAIQSELKTVFTRAIFRDPEFRTLDDIRDERKEAQYRDVRNKIQTQLEDLQQREEQTYSRTILNKVLDSQNDSKSSFINLGGFISISKGKLDLLA